MVDLFHHWTVAEFIVLGGFIDVRNNWWGSSRGPSLLLFPFRGDKLKHRFGWALYRPWATEPIPDAGRQ